jgi:hypothetical protein
MVISLCANSLIRRHSLAMIGPVLFSKNSAISKSFDFHVISFMLQNAAVVLL